MPASRLCLLGVLIATTGLALAACSPTVPPAAAQPVAEVQAANAAAEAARPVGFSLGPNRFVLPANWFADGFGPDFQGGVTLALHWPSLEPYPPGQPYGSFTTGPMRDQRVLVTVNYIDRVPIDELPERYVTASNEFDLRDPSENLALRDRLPDRFGLEVYRTDLEKVAAHAAHEMQRPTRPSEFYLRGSDDWFIARDDSGRIRSVAMCTDDRVPGGFEIRDDALVSVPGFDPPAAVRPSFLACRVLAVDQRQLRPSDPPRLAPHRIRCPRCAHPGARRRLHRRRQRSPRP